MTGLLPVLAALALWIGYELGWRDSRHQQARHEAMRRHPATWHHRNEDT